jgi:hypothetical protein
MKLAELATTVQDAITVSRVFADPYQKDGVTIIAAALAGGAVVEVDTTSAARKARAEASG